MKISFLLLALGCMIGCQKADEPAPEALYRRWKAENADVYITFLREGIVLYGKDSTETSCCPRPMFFRTGVNRLVFKDVSPKPLPVQLTYRPCPFVLCGLPSYADWEIISVTTDQLVLDAEYRGRQTYVAAP